MLPDDETVYIFDGEHRFDADRLARDEDGVEFPGGVPVAFATMRVVKPGEDGWLKQVLDCAPDAVLVRNLAGIGFFREHAPQLPLIGDYAAAKAGVINLSKTAPTEFRAYGVRVNAVCTGFVDTDLVRVAKPDFEAALGIDFDATINRVQGRMGQVGDVAPLVVFLASDRSRFSTGSAFVVDGGMSSSLV